MSDHAAMTLRILRPEKVLLERRVRKVVAEGESGSFGLLPRHVDFVEALVPGILTFEPAAPHAESEEGGADATLEDVFVAVDEGVLVKCGHIVYVSVRNAVVGPELGTLEDTVRERFQRIDEREGAMRTALARMESEVIRSFVEFE
jgi:F-type H+-transporting ATPase subunit epsilon